ncbi:hypothetical protein ACIBCO_41305 [Streptomyces violascens]|uniref:hypothetical protein n=1 Tax=Streptomyces violascens TaxID=67381 RepID=UPI0037A2F9AA
MPVIVAEGLPGRLPDAAHSSAPGIARSVDRFGVNCTSAFGARRRELPIKAPASLGSSSCNAAGPLNAEDSLSSDQGVPVRTLSVRHEALLFRTEVEDHRRFAVVAAR